MRQSNPRRSTALIVLTLLASLVMFVSPGTANAAESIPTLKWPAVKVSNYPFQVIANPADTVTVDCAGQDDSSTGNLRTYSATGQLVRELSQATKVDGVENCISWRPAVDKNGDIYGTPEGLKDSGGYGYGPNLLAYSGNTLKWKYPHGCSSLPASATVGADGNICFINGSGRLIGLTPNVEPGTTQPKKVLDVAAISGCGEYIHALKDGIAVVKDMHVKFFSYNGVNLGGPSNAAWIYDNVNQISATGRVFYATYIESGGLRSAAISAYDSGRKEVMWTTTASADGSYVYDAQAQATPDGGAVVYLRQKETNALGEWTGKQAFSLVKLNTFGIKVWSKTLPLVDASGNTYADADVKVDTNGNIAVVRVAKLKTTNGGFENAVSVAVFDGGGNGIFSNILRGNLDNNAGSTTGYYLSTGQTNLGVNTLYVTAQQCGGTSCYGDTKLFPIQVAGLGLDYPRGVAYTETPRPTASYIALGDSFSSGEGVEPFEVGTSTPKLNTCHRSDYAYARLISGTSAKIPSLGGGGFRACSGAVTDNIADAPQWNEGTQLDLPVWPDSTTQLVTLTIGGNDIKFADFGRACFFGTCEIGSAAYNASLNEINNTLPNKLAATYQRILQYAPNAKVYVVGYPQVVANKSINDADDSRCFYMQDGSTKWADAKAARDIVTKLNAKTLAKVDAVRSLNADFYQRLKYVPLDGAGSPFNSHEVCGTSGTSWFKNVDTAITDPAYAFHPNKLGQEGYATVVGAAINAG